MTSVFVLIVRLLLSVGISFIVCRVFYHDTSGTRIMGLAALIFILAYLFEYLRSLGKGDKE
ncbi:MAG: hypothetical protein DRH37_06705 [Deltaproteobacteria bacterium]|nr:MAG: hypothetical protein DRH37_06705 [Deltaproteobacteria bacterium]